MPTFNKPDFESPANRGFTLIELMVIMIIMGILVSLISGNVLNSLQKGRDARRKNDLAQVQKALELYYEDIKMYPSGVPAFGSAFCNATGVCPTTAKIYMRKLPEDPNADYEYNYLVDGSGQSYYLFSCIENYWNDKGQNVSNGGYCPGPQPTPCGAAVECGGCGTCKFYISSPNAIPLIPKPTLSN